MEETPCRDRRVGRRVLIVAPQSFFSVSGTPISVQHMCRALTELSYEVHLLTLPFGESIGMSGLVYHRVRRLPMTNMVPRGFSVAKAFYDLVLAVETVRLLRRQRFLAVHAIEEAALFAVPIARFLRTAAISDLDSDLCAQLKQHRSVFVRALAVPASLMRRVALRRSTCVITVAKSLTDLVCQESPGTPLFEIRDIPLQSCVRAPDAERVKALREELGLGTCRAIVYTGNLDRIQGIEGLITAIPAVRQRCQDVVLIIVGGDRHEVERMRLIADNHGIGDFVSFLETQPTEMMPEIMALASVLISPRIEPLVTPLKIYSYMASGRPIVATDLQTHTEVLDDKTAVLVAPTAPGLADGIIWALENPEVAQCRGQRARQKVEELHSFDIFKEKVSAAYTYIEQQALHDGKSRQRTR